MSRRFLNPHTVALSPPRMTLTVSSLQSRYYTILGSSAFKPNQYTKYRVTTDFSATSDHEDLYLAEPSRDDLVKVNKDEPIFLRFLKIVTDQGKRPDVFKAFAKRCEAGLVVEKDVYVTKMELLEALWENGYTDLELNAYEIAFPADYRFHYPELAVLYGLEEEECYSYCLKKRAAKPDDLVEVQHKPTPSKIASYGLLSTAIWFGLQNNVLGNMWMMVKTWPFFAVFYMLASHFQKQITAKIHAEGVNETKVAMENRLEGEDQVYMQMRKYANDSLCLDYLESFRPSVEKQLKDYRRAALLQLRTQMLEGVTKHLLAVQQAERAIESVLQDVIISETTAAFHEAYTSSTMLHQAAFDAAVEALSQSDEVELKDPVGDFFRDSFRKLAKPTGQSDIYHLVERVNGVFEKQEKEFLDQFTITEAEAKKIREVNNSIKRKFGVDESTGGPNLSRLSEDGFRTIENLYLEMSSKVGFGCLPLSMGAPLPVPLTSADPACDPFLDEINALVQSRDKHLRIVQLQSFMQSFQK